MKKRILIFLFSALVLSSGYTADEPATAKTIDFKDMPAKHWAANSVYNCVRLGITKGYPDGTFRGEQQVNRYELMVFLSNLSIALEKMVDAKLEENTFASEDGAVSNKALEELKTEVEILKEQLSAGNATGGVKQNDLTPHFNLLFYTGPLTATTANENTFTEQQLFYTASLRLTKNIDDNTGFETELNNITLLEMRGWSKRKFSDYLALSVEATVGGGQLLLSNKKIYNGYYPGFKLGLTSFGVNGYVGYNTLGTALNAFDIDSDGLLDDLKISRVMSGVTYRLPIAIPYIGFWTINAEIEKYYSETNRVLNDQMTATRYISRQTFEITKELSFKSQYIKELTSLPAFNLDGEAIHAEKQGTYYDATLTLGDVFKTGTTVAIMSAYKGSNFGQNNLLQPTPAANSLGYSSCGYFANDWDSQNRLPSANITTETGIALQQNLYKKELFLNLAAVQGLAIPDSALSDDDTKYTYTLGLVGIDWYLTPYFKTFINYETRALNDSTIENTADQYSDKLAVLGMNLNF